MSFADPRSDINTSNMKADACDGTANGSDSVTARDGELDSNRHGNSLSYRRKVCFSMVLYASFFALGVSWGLIGPTLMDLEILTQSETDTISLVFMGRAVGGLVGAVTAGLAMDIFDHWLTLFGASSLLTVALGNVTAPWSRTVPLLTFWHFVLGSSGSFIDAGGNLALLAVWGKDNGSWIQALHFIYGVGTTVSPLVAEPFLASSDNRDGCSTHDDTAVTAAYNVTDNVTMQTSTSDLTLEKSTSSDSCRRMDTTNVMYAYLVTVAVVACTALAFFVIFWISGHQIHRPRGEKGEGPRQDDRQQRKERGFRITMMIMVFIFYMEHCMLENVYGNYIMSFSVKYLGWSKAQGAVLNSAFWGMYTFTRGCAIAIIRFVRPHTLLFAASSIALVSLAPIMFFVTLHRAVLWVCSLGAAAGVSLFYATGYTWTEQYVVISGLFGSVFPVGGAIGELVGPPLAGALFQHISPMAYIYMCFTVTCLVLGTFTTLHFIASRHGVRRAAEDRNSDKELEMMNVENRDTGGEDVLA